MVSGPRQRKIRLSGVRRIEMARYPGPRFGHNVKLTGDADHRLSPRILASGRLQLLLLR